MSIFYKRYFVGVRDKNIIKYVTINLDETNYTEFLNHFFDKIKEETRKEFWDVLTLKHAIHTVNNLDELVENAIATESINGILLVTESACLAAHRENDNFNFKVYDKITPNEPAGGFISSLNLRNADKFKVRKNAVNTLASFIEFKKHLHSALNKFPKNEKFSMCKNIIDNSYKIYNMIITLISSDLIDREPETFFKSYREVNKIIVELRYTFYLAYHMNYYYRCKNDGTRNRNITETIDADKNRKGYTLMLGFYSSFLSDYYILCAKIFHRKNLISLKNYKGTLSLVKEKSKVYMQMKNDGAKLESLTNSLANIEQLLTNI